MHRRSLLASGIVALAAAQTTLVSSQLSSSPSGTVATGGASPTEPCGLIASAQAEVEKPLGYLVKAEYGYQCLQSVPVDKEGDSMLIDEIKLYLEWNSNTEYLKGSLPEWYDNPSIDIYEELDNIKSGLMNDEYESEWEVQSAITQLFTQTGDNHISWSADINAVITFQKSTNLVSVSNDGKSKPQVYSYDDLKYIWNGVYNFTASPIVKINGEETTKYLQKLARQGTYHDAHARWNALFPNQAGISLGNLALGNWAYSVYDGANTTFTFANGSSSTFSDSASINKDFSGVTDGKSFFAKFCAPQPSSVSTLANTPTASEAPVSPTSSVSQPESTKAPGYPFPVVLHPVNAIGGYYLNDSSDVAVLSIPTFSPKYKSPEYSQQANDDFQTVAREFLKKAAANGKSKLVIDLRFNGGGSTVLGFDLFKLVFPNLEPYQATRRRAHEAFKQIVDLADAESKRILALENPTEEDVLEVSNLSEFAYQLAITPNDTEFSSAEEFYGPHEFDNDYFTSLRGQNLTNTLGWATNFSVSGYEGPLATRQPAWNASDIVLLQDGFCSSTCAIFSELMRTLAGVETLAIGGLPDDDIPMQKVGGTKGWLTWELDSLDNFSYNFYRYSNQSAIDTVNGTEISKMNHTSVIWDRFESFQVNAADGIRQGDKEEQTPLQFVYEAAECRIWYTVPMVFDVEEVWKAASNVKWGNGTCNAGKGFGTLAKEGDGGNQTEESSPGHHNAAAGFSVPALSVFAAAFAVVVSL